MLIHAEKSIDANPHPYLSSLGADDTKSTLYAI